ncbi:MAG: sensor histidine kinase [Methyloligellaceae bacterium]
MTTNIEDLRKEYESFAYIVSHDLNAPLRHVKQFSELLMKERKDTATSDELVYMNFLHKALNDLENMQSALLTFSRISTKAGPILTFDCQPMVQHISETVKLNYVDSKPVIHLETLPKITGDQDKLASVFYNIIDNALKFNTSTPKECRISCEEREKDFLFKIEDNGIGIPEGHHTDVFQMFRRLNTSDTYPGTGAGLAFTKKIIEIHNGEVSISSVPDQGTVVQFTLPK